MPGVGAPAAPYVLPAVIAVLVNIVPMAGLVVFVFQEKATIKCLNHYRHNQHSHQNKPFGDNAGPSRKKDRSAAGRPVPMVIAGNTGDETCNCNKDKLNICLLNYHTP